VFTKNSIFIHAAQRHHYAVRFGYNVKFVFICYQVTYFHLFPRIVFGYYDNMRSVSLLSILLFLTYESFV